ncbi:MAG: hypothetical protein ACI9HK_003868 [Pirellulaceae bacterium]|jgi:hypothetical protein
MVKTKFLYLLRTHPRQNVTSKSKLFFEVSAEIALECVNLLPLSLLLFRPDVPPTELVVLLRQGIFLTAPGTSVTTPVVKMVDPNGKRVDRFSPQRHSIPIHKRVNATAGVVAN